MVDFSYMWLHFSFLTGSVICFFVMGSMVIGAVLGLHHSQVVRVRVYGGCGVDLLLVRGVGELKYGDLPLPGPPPDHRDNLQVRVGLLLLPGPAVLPRGMSTGAREAPSMPFSSMR